MDEYRDGDLERILEDPGAQPCILPFQLLKYITNDFSSELELGRGGFGIVYKGILQNRKMVAVKILLSTRESQEDQFKREVGNLMRVQHKNIVRFLGYCYESVHQYTEYGDTHVFAESPKRLLCFEYVPNGGLDKHIYEESYGFDWRERYKIIKGICRGIHYLHEECQEDGSIIHMDLKPVNILLDTNMVPKIADFGLSKFFNGEKLETCATTLMGSCGYMAPEYYTGGIISKKADIYSLGVIIIKIITGRMIDVTSCDDFVGPVLENWSNRQEAIPSENDCEHIKVCLKIGLRCLKSKREKRPSIREILENLNKWETTMGYVSDEETPRAYDKEESRGRSSLSPPALEEVVDALAFSQSARSAEEWSSNGSAVPELQSPPGLPGMPSESESDDDDGDAARLLDITPEYNPWACRIHTGGIDIIYDDRGGARWCSRARFIPGSSVDVKFRAPDGDASGLRYNIYLSSTGGSIIDPDEIHFEFPGCNKWAVQTKYFIKGKGGREQMHKLPFDSSDGFHHYTIAWKDDAIEWRVDGELVRREERRRRRYLLGDDELWTTKPMFLYASVCDASHIDEGGWAGMYNGRDAPYVCSFEDIRLPTRRYSMR